MLLRFVEFLAQNDTRCLDSQADRMALARAFEREFALERELIASVIDGPRAGFTITEDSRGRIHAAITEVRSAYGAED